MLYKKLTVFIFSLLFILPKALWASNFFVHVSNKSEHEYERLEIIIQPVGFSANLGRLMIENISQGATLTYEIEEDELNTPFLPLGRALDPQSNLDITIHAVPKRDYIKSKYFKRVLKTPKSTIMMVITDDGTNQALGLQVPNMIITISKEGNILARFSN